jgi:outer membrane biosynthesis protein TonB
MENTQTPVKVTKKNKQVKQQPVIVEEKPSETTAEVEPSVVEEQPQPTEVRLVDIPIENENVALNVMVGFLNLAHKRGAFTIDESAKIWECISKFQKK